MERPCCGLINAVVSIPDGLTSAALAGVNPIYDLYASIAALIAGSLIVTAQLMLGVIMAAPSQLLDVQVVPSLQRHQHAAGGHAVVSQVPLSATALKT